jgi:hypothetical protein
MITADSQPMSAAPLDGTPIRLFVSAGSVIASFWSEERCQKTFGAGCYRAGWYLLDDDTKELDDPLGWEPLVHGHACSDAWAKIDASEWLAGFPALDYGWLVKGEYLSVDFGDRAIPFHPSRGFARSRRVQEPSPAGQVATGTT